MIGMDAGTHTFRIRMIKAIKYMETEVNRFGFPVAGRLLHVAAVSIAEREYKILDEPIDHLNVHGADNG